MITPQPLTEQHSVRLSDRLTQHPAFGMSAPYDRKIYAPGRCVTACNPAPNIGFNCSVVTSSPWAEADPLYRVARPVTGRLTLGTVLGRQRGVAPAGRIYDGDQPGQVLIPRLGNQVLHADRHRAHSPLPEGLNIDLRGHRAATKTLRYGGHRLGATAAAGRGQHVCAPLSTPVPIWLIGQVSRARATLSLTCHRHCRGQSAERGAGEKCLVNGT